MRTIVFSGSIRSCEAHLEMINQIAIQAKDLNNYVFLLKEKIIKKKIKICNSDILTGAILHAMHKCGAECRNYSLTKLFPSCERKVVYESGQIIDPELATTDTLSLDQDELEKIMDEISSADGVCLVSPVYFGDRSSVANKVLQICGIHNLLEGKIFGAAAVGAKRNGGQETAIIYCLMEALSQKALIVGNGAPTSQYGGTGVGGHRGAVIDDVWGLETAFGVGTKVAQVSEIVKRGKKSRIDHPVHILLLLTMDDNEGVLYSFLQDYLKKAEKIHGNVKFSMINLLDLTIYRCLGCRDCPAENKLPLGRIPDKANHSHCIIRTDKDAMEYIHEEMLGADSIIIAGLNVKGHHRLVYRYQVLVERTRYIRRDNFELENIPMVAFSMNQVGARVNSLHSLKTTTSYIRHNSIFHRPIEAFFFDAQVLDDGMDDLLSFINFTEIIKNGRRLVSHPPSSYSTKGIGGY